MGTDSTELTFIRCPSCKSLVPAASPRCRMCGSALEASKKPSESEDAGQKKNNFQRARQHTINVNPEERTKLENQETISTKSAVKPAAVIAKPAPVEETEQESDFDEDASAFGDSADLGDPLGAFLEEVTEEESNSFPGEELDLNDEPVFAKENGSHSPETLKDDSFTSEPQQKTKKTFIQGRDSASVLKPRQPSKAGLSFSKSKPSEKPVFTSESTQEDDDLDFFKEKEEVAEIQPKVEEKQARSVLRPPTAVKTAASNEVKSTADVKGRLYGWMVSYKDPKGTATELREGKFFLSRSSLKGSDLIIDDSSISTPHALFGISSSEGVKLQDLMSDRGVFVRKKGSETYQRMLESIKLEHGDWVRFGDVEFQIAIL